MLQRTTILNLGFKEEAELRKLMEGTMGRRPHVLMIPFPSQGHVKPLMRLAYRISDHGIKVTFVVSGSIHEKVVAALLLDEEEARKEMVLTSIPDGLGPGDFNDLTDSIVRVMPGQLKNFIEKVNNSNDEDKITCVIADTTVGWALEVAQKMGIVRVAFCPFGPGSLALVSQIPRLIQTGVLSSTDGSLLQDESISLSKDVPAFSSNTLPWYHGDTKSQEIVFGLVIQCVRALNLANWLLCNSVYELDSYACDLIPDILPIGPLLASNHLGHSDGNFWPEDSTCISWLDNQTHGSVIYVAFGSTTIFKQEQFNELALGLELAGLPFLWVVRAGFTKGSVAEYPDGFIERVAGQGKIVSWAPQEKVLAHPAVACFLSHCGWNSTMDGIGMGVPFLCWPYAVDQFHNQSYICNKWKVGLGLINDEDGLISRHEIKKKIEKLVSDDCIKANAEKVKEMTGKSVSEGGSSYKNFQTFVEAIKQ